jgi:hypothetical protein
MTDATDNTVAAWLQQEAERREQIAEVRPINKAALFDALAKAGVTRVVVSFDGSGDSGQIESIDAFAGDNTVDLPAAQIELAYPADNRGGLNRTTHTVQDAIETLAYDMLEEEHDGWENNDGAFGEFTFDVKERSVTLGYNERFSDSTYHEHIF